MTTHFSTGFENRKDAGQRLGAHLRGLHAWPNTLVLGLPRGGVPVAAEVARAVAAPLDVFLVRKLGLPAHPELAIGAIASGGGRWLNQELIGRIGLPTAVIQQVEAQEAQELARREQRYRARRPPLNLKGQTVLVVDDGLATGATMRAALQALNALGAARTVVAVPVAPSDVCEELRAVADEVVCLLTPPAFQAVGLWYRDFPQVSDAEVQALLGGVTHA